MLLPMEAFFASPLRKPLVEISVHADGDILFAQEICYAALFPLRDFKTGDCNLERPMQRCPSDPRPVSLKALRFPPRLNFFSSHTRTIAA